MKGVKTNGIYRTCFFRITFAVVSNKEQLTYSEFWKEICRAAHFFRKNGINKGNRVAIKAAQSPSYLICYYGIQLAGAVPCALEQNMPSSSTVQVALKLKADTVISEKKCRK